MPTVSAERDDHALLMI